MKNNTSGITTGDFFLLVKSANNIKNNIVKKYNRKDIDVDFISDFIEVSVEGYFMKKTRFPNVKDSVKETIFTDEVFEKIIKFIDDSLSKK